MLAADFENERMEREKGRRNAVLFVFSSSNDMDSDNWIS